MIVHDSWWSNGSARSTIIDYHEPFDVAEGLNVVSDHKKELNVNNEFQFVLDTDFC